MARSKEVQVKPQHCPSCGVKIDFVIAIVDERNSYDLSFGGNREFRDGIESNDDCYQCPHCYKTIGIEDVDEFLKGRQVATIPPEKANLWLARIDIRDGENEYDTDVFLRALNEGAARVKGDGIARTWLESDDDKLSATLNADGWFEMSGGEYRWTRCKRITKVDTLDDVIEVMGGLFGD